MHHTLTSGASGSFSQAARAYPSRPMESVAPVRYPPRYMRGQTEGSEGSTLTPGGVSANPCQPGYMSGLGRHLVTVD